jgi:glutathione S-transferase
MQGFMKRRRLAYPENPVIFAPPGTKGSEMARIILYGFDGSTYVRTVRMLLAEKGAQYEQVPVNVLQGEPRQPEHLARHPFGKVPVVDHDGFRIIETSAIAPYLDEVLPGPSFTPDNPRDRARMRMAVGIIDSYGYGALVSVAGYHLFPDFVGGRNEAARRQGIATSQLVLRELMKLRGDDAFIAGARPSIGDLYLAPICFYVALTPDANEVFAVDGFVPWWERMQAMPSYEATAPQLG